MTAYKVTVIPGDGIGPEVVQVALDLVKEAGVHLDIELCEAGESVFAKGVASGVMPETIESIKRTRLALKGPLATPVGHGGKSANVTLRKLFETYGNVRPAKELPSVQTPFSGRGIDLLVVRENVEDLYAGIEHMQTPSVAQCLKLISRLGCEKIVRLAFELARSEGRKKVHCATKANIMKLSEGLLKKVFEEVAPEYPDIQAEHIIVDNLAHLLVIKPETFDVIVSTNMNGDIISDLTSGLIGGLGFAPSANIGDHAAIFEAVHGSAPDIAGQDKANPTAIILSTTMLLRYIKEMKAAETIENALLYTLEKGDICTGDVRKPGARIVGTKEFGATIVAHFGKAPSRGKVENLKPFTIPSVKPREATKEPTQRKDIGIDVFIESLDTPEAIGTKLSELSKDTGLKLLMVSNRGTCVYPLSGTPIDCVDHWRCRFTTEGKTEIKNSQITALLDKVQSTYRWMQVEKLLEVEGEEYFSKSQGQN
jgi:isocitrate dehydrogenase